MGLIPDDLEDPYPDTVEYFTSIEEKMRKDNTRCLYCCGPDTSDREQPSAAPLNRNGVSSLPRMRPSKS
jgi:hypothetical protein